MPVQFIDCAGFLVYGDFHFVLTLLIAKNYCIYLFVGHTESFHICYEFGLLFGSAFGFALFFSILQSRSLIVESLFT